VKSSKPRYLLFYLHETAGLVLLSLGRRMKRISLLAVFLAMTQSACMMVGGYSSGGGWFIWPGGLGLVVMLLLLFFFLRRGR